MRGDFVKLVENVNALSEEREDILSAIEQMIASIGETYKNKQETFWVEVKKAVEAEDRLTLDDNFRFNGKTIILDSPLALVPPEYHKLMKVNYTTKEDVEDFIEQVVKQVEEGVKKLEFLNPEVDEESQKFVTMIKRAFVREIVAGLLSQITIESEEVGHKEVRKLVNNVIREVS